MIPIPWSTFEGAFIICSLNAVKGVLGMFRDEVRGFRV